MRMSTAGALVLVLVTRATTLRAQDTSAVQVSGDSVTVRFLDADLRVAVQALGRYLDRPVMLAGLPSTRVTLETPHPIARADVLPLLRGLVESQNLELVRDSAFYRIRQKEQQPAPQPAAAGQATLRQAPELAVVRLRHARAADVSATLASLYGVGGGDLAGGAPRIGTLSDELRRNIVPPQEAGGSPARTPASAVNPASPALLDGAVTVVPDPYTNSLLIRASSHDEALLREAIDSLDVRPLQVLIEVVIVEARRDRQMAYGLGLSMPRTGIHGGGGATVGVDQQGGGLGDFVVNVMHVGHADINALLQAGASRGDVQILSRPVLLASNNQPARFLVGSQRPFIQVSYSIPTAGATRDQVVQYKDVGTRLSVRPTISSDGYVALDVVQEISNATDETAFDAPVIATREAATQVLVRDGQTIVLGGLTDKQVDVTSGGVPFLSTLPLIGGLFGRHNRQTTETELFLFLTPRILRSDDDVERATTDYRDRAPEAGRAVVPSAQPHP